MKRALIYNVNARLLVYDNMLNKVCNTSVCDFGKITNSKKVLSGKTIAIIAKNELDINNLFKDNDKIIFKIPDTIFAITPSFLEEFLSDILYSYSREEISNKIELCQENKYDLTIVLEEVLNRASIRNSIIR